MARGHSTSEGPCEFEATVVQKVQIDSAKELQSTESALADIEPESVKSYSFNATAKSKSLCSVLE